jgi:glutamate synthase (ferredoxin)
VENFFRFIAEEVREYMAQLGFRTMDEMIGKVERLNYKPAVDHWKAKGLDFSAILHQPEGAFDTLPRCVRPQNHGLADALDNELIARCADALDHLTPVSLDLPIRNVHRTVGTMLGYEVTRRYGAEGLPDDTIRIHFTGSAGQSFGAFVPKGITLMLEGDSNDYIGKGLSGGRLVAYPSRRSTFVAEDNIIVGNVALYGATSGEAYIGGRAGERFAVRNSGALAVVEGVGDHGCEYMTGGAVVVLGRTGRNFAAGMSGGMAYVFDTTGSFPMRCNPNLVDLEPLADLEDLELVKSLVTRHLHHTSSQFAARILDDWSNAMQLFVKVMPRDYKRVLTAQKQAAAEGRTPDFAELVGA